MTAISPPWVLVCSDFVRHGGMDRANYELALWLAKRGGRVDLVGHRVEPDLAAYHNVVFHCVRRPMNAQVLGNLLLERQGYRIASARVVAEPRTRVLVNGGNCPWFDANWVHAVHHAWKVRDEGAPLIFRAKNHAAKWSYRAAEAEALGSARVVIANSEKTKRELVTLLGLEERRVHVIYLGSDPEVDRPSSLATIEARRRSLGIAPDAQLVLFVGALGSDRNKGLDTLLDAWKLVQQRGGGAGAARLFAIGAGVTPMWHQEVRRRGLAGEVTLLGFRRDASELLGAADLMVAPSRYDSYGLAVQEALCRHVPVIVSSQAGIAERYPAPLQPLVLTDPENATELAARIVAWRAEKARFAAPVAALGDELRAHDWTAMAAQMVATIEA